MKENKVDAVLIIRIEKEVKEDLSRLSKAGNQTPTAVVRKLIKSWIKYEKKAEEIHKLNAR